MRKWISVKDKMPPINQRVLVYAVGKIDGFIGKNVIEICERFVQSFFSSSTGKEVWSSPYQFFHTDYEITHWMELPNSPDDLFREKVIELAEEMGIHNLYAMVKEIRGE